jgi:Tc toxin complex TcA C-terminal TcB-binding domain
MSDNYLVIRLTPTSPVDGAIFAQYLANLTIDVYQANSQATLLGSASYSSSLFLTQVPDGSYISSLSLPTSQATTQANIGPTLSFDSTEGIPIGAYAFIFDTKGNNFFASNTTVTGVTDTTVTLSQNIPAFLPAQTVVSFIWDYKNLNKDPWATSTLSFTEDTNAIAKKGKSVLPLKETTGIFYGMSVTTASSGLIADTTTVSAVDSTSVTLSKPLLKDVASGTTISFTYPLGSGIVQHLESTSFTILGFQFGIVYPGSVATAIIQLNETPPPLLDISVKVARGPEEIPTEDIYYNVKVYTSSLPTTPDQFQFIPAENTSFYISLPAPPTNKNAISLTIPSDGTPPNFNDLKNAVTAALQADPTISPTPVTDIASLTPDQCSQIAYDIVWSQQSLLPKPPDQLSDLYTNPPNNGGNNNDEQDRQKFEGDLKSYYSTRNAEAQRLARFVYSLSLALSFYEKSQAATSVRFQFPIIDDNTTLTTIKEAAVLLNNGVDPQNQPLPINPDFTPPGFAVPAEYFYALVIGLPPQSVSQSQSQSQQQQYQQQYQLTCLMNEQQVLSKLYNAINKKFIDGPQDPNKPPDPNALPITPEQAARNLAALGDVGYNDPQCSLNTYPDIQALVQAWLKEPGDGTAIDTFWKGAVTNPTYQGGYLDLVLCLVTNNFQPLIDAIKAIPAAGGLGVSTVEALAKLQVQDWETFFKNNANLLPPFTAPGSTKQPPPTNPKAIKAQADVFVRNLQSFFQVSAGSSQVPSVNPNTPPTLYRENSSFDPIQEFISAYPGFAFGPGLDPTQQAFLTALDAVFSNDPPAREWLEQTILAINAVYVVTASGIPLPGQPGDPDLRFSVMEALYARGFTSAQSVLNLSPDDFQQALTGTVAYPYAPSIQSNAGTWQPGPSQQGGFQPINADGCLVNCIPPFYLSPLGPSAYLREMLRVTETSTCEIPQPENVENTLGRIIAQRRGNLGSLPVTEANLETPLPLIDIVNECLEAVAAQVPVSSPPAGVVYNTAGDMLDEHKLCADEDDEHDKHDSHVDQSEASHKPATLFAAVPQYSSPATPVAQPGAYDKLKSDFSSCHLPYSQPLDINRSYLRQLETSRYAVMRRFRKDITEFVLDPNPADEPAGFQRHLWRYPVRIEIAREYLDITPEEYDLLFTQDIATTATTSKGDQLLLWQVYGYVSQTVRDTNWVQLVIQVSEFLKRTCLTYCEFLELWKSEFVKFQCYSEQREGENRAFPDCEPCCLDDYYIQFENPENPDEALKLLAVFIRLWRKLQHVKNAKYSFTQLSDICKVLNLFKNGSINPDFIRQLAAFQMLRDHLGLRLNDNSSHQSATGQAGADRTHLLALWVGKSAGKWTWAVQHLLERVQHYARNRHRCGNRSAHFIKLLVENLNPLSLLVGFDPTSATDTWHALPTHTLRFAEVLSKIYASDFSVGEILFLFTADNHLDGDDPFPLPDDNEALDFPLAFPDDEEGYSLRALRRKLLAVSVSKEEAERWTWRHIESSLRHEFGYEPTADADPLLSIGEHFFPDVLAACGNHVDMKQRQYRVVLPDTGTNATNPAIWNTPDSPFRYDTRRKELWIRLPLTDEEVFEKLSHIRQLNQAEQDAVQSLYFAPRVDLAAFAFIFSNFGAAVEHLIQEEDEEKRWAYFRHEFARCHARSRVIAEHLAHHVAAASGQEHPDGVKLAWRLLQHLFADENRATTRWETDSGQVPAVTWQQQPNGGAFAALLGLTGTGLLGEFAPEGGNLVWNEMRGPMSAFGHEKNRWNIPVPTVLPVLNLTLSSKQARFAGIRNGFAIKGQNGETLGGPQGFSVRWQGILLVEREGMYEFYAGSPTPEGERPDFEAAEQRRWRVTLKRGQKTWVVLAHHWPNTQAPAAHAAPLALRSGAYQITVEFEQPEAVFTQDETRPQHTGFQVKYCGPDSEDHLITIPLDRLYLDEQNAPLGASIDRGGAAEEFMGVHFTSTLRDMRRTYQRAFKALLFAHRFGLSAKPINEYGQSEIGYMLAHPDLFEGTSYYRQAQNTGFGTHHAYFDFNFLPLLDNYSAPSSTVDPGMPSDLRVQPSPQRQQALFDWWERIFDYVQVRKETQYAREHPLWLLFEEAAEKQPDDPAQLLRHVGVDLDHADLTTHYYPGYSISSTDLEDERWAIRAWHAEEWIRDLLSDFAAKDIQAAHPDLWASDDPNALSQSGNDNLTSFVRDGCIENGRPRRYKDIEQLNDELREHARRALLAYLCCMNRVLLPAPLGDFAREADDLSALLLLDVEVGLHERASRIEEAISAVQTYIQRCRLGLDAGFNISPEFIRLWDRCFASFHVWQAYKRREIYRENWIDWEEIQKAQGSEAFRFLEMDLQRDMLTAPRPGALEYWPDQGIPAHVGLATIQSREPDYLQRFTMPSNQAEGFNLLGTQERDARPSWLAALQTSTSSGGNPNPNGNPNGNPNPVISSPIERVASTAIVKSDQPGTTQQLPLWIEAAIRLGVRFLRVAAAGEPPASTRFAPWHAESETGICCECGKRHPAVVDEYYFWLLDSRYYDDLNNPLSKEDTPPPQDATWDWENPNAVPGLLHWDSKPMVQLAWCRVHNGEFQQPRRSVEGVALALDDKTPPHLKTPPQLELLGRSDDSLTFKVEGGMKPGGYNGTEQPGFRYDLATDQAVTLPLVVTPPGTGATYPPGLSAYPFFAYFAPGTSVMPPSLFSPALAVAGALRAHCRFEEALKWYALAFNPLQEDCSWCSQEQTVTAGGTTGSSGGVSIGAPATTSTGVVVEVKNAVAEGSTGTGAPAMTPTNLESTPAPESSQIPRASATSTEGAEPTVGSNGRAASQTDGKTDNNPGPLAVNTEPGRGNGHGSMSCCSSIAVSDDEARNRSIMLHYLETLHEWAEALMRRNSLEAFQQARLILDTEAYILGMHPRSVKEANTGNTQQKEPPTVINFTPACAPLNPRLLALYDLVDDGLALIHDYLDARRLREGHRKRDRSYWGNTELRNGWQTADGPCADEEGGCCPPSPYRFTFLIQKAQELANQVKELGSALLAAFEKGDAEYLASLRQIHERQLLELTLEIRRNQWREADWQVQALQKTQAATQSRRQYNALLIQNGLISGEVQHEALTEVTLSGQETGRVLEGIGTVLGIIPDVNVGTLDFVTIPIGSKMQGVFSGMSQIVNSQAGSAGTTGGLRLTQAGWDRREADWRQQVLVLDIENEQIERQILAAERRRDIALRELNNHQQQMEHSAEVQDFLRDKFTNHALYLYLQQDTAMLYSRMYELALCAAQQAQRSFNYERGHTVRHFLPDEGWDSLHEGLLAGERLQLALRHMEKAYLDENVREYELAKHFSLRLHFPREFLLLKETGFCEIEIPEWMFDLDYPGHYMRRIRNVSLSIPCVVGPYTGVHCRLTLLRSMTRVHPRLRDPLIECCDDDDFDNGYRPRYDDPRIVTQYAATEAIATSSGQNDSGLFELNFRDERYLPFEFMGAVCRVRIELPHENNQFDIDSVTDLILHLNYTAREGGEVLRRAANEVAQQHLPGAGMRYFDIRHEFPDAWHRFQGSFTREEAPKHLGIRLSRDMFPFIPGHRELWVNRLDIFFEASEAEPGSHKVVKFLVGQRAGQRDEDRDDREVHEITCVASEEWPDFYHGVLDIRLGPLAQRADHDLGTFRFPPEMGIVSRAFLLCGYNVKRRHSDERSMKPEWHK